MELVDLIKLLLKGFSVFNHGQFHDAGEVLWPLLLKEVEVLFESALDVEVAEEDSCVRNLLSKRREQLEMTLYDNSLGHLVVHVLKEALNSSSEE